jgi:nucleoside-diphosphate-sugar epimerase
MPKPSNPHLLIFGHGFVGAALARRMAVQGWRVSGVTRDPAKAPAINASGVAPILAGDAPALAQAVAGAQAILIAAPPDANGCPGLAALSEAIARTGAFPDWIGYLSTTGVYGDAEGGWCFETSPLRARSVEGARRVGAERDWRQLGRGMGLTVTAFRLPGLYGPGRSALERLKAGNARRIDKPGHVIGRVHVEDVAAGLAASIERPRAGASYNLVDDEPAPAHAVIEHAAHLMGMEPPPLEAWTPDLMSGPAARFYTENRRVSNALAKAELGWKLAYPSYREGLYSIFAR